MNKIAGVLGPRLAAVAPIARLSLVDPDNKSTWIVEFAPEATVPQRAAAQAVIDGWTEADWDGTAAERRRNRIRELMQCHNDRGGLVIEKTYWEGQPVIPANTAKVNAIQGLIDDTDTRILQIRSQL